MPTILEIELADAPPAQGSGGSFDRIPAGPYLLETDKIGLKQTQEKAQPMVQVSFLVAEGQYKGKRLGINFVLPREGTQDNAFGKQRFHAFLIALGFKQQTELGKKAKLDLDKLLHKKCESDVIDRIRPASPDGKYAERIFSEPDAFFRIGGRGKSPNGTVAPQQAIAAPEAPAPPASEMEDDELALGGGDAAEDDDLFA